MLFNKNGNEIVEENGEFSKEAEAYIMEAIMCDELSKDELSMFLENTTEVDAALTEGVLLERTIVRLDKKAKLSKAKKMAVFAIAKEKNDPNFKKLLNVWRVERYLEAILEKKYGNEATRRAKKMVTRRADKKSVSDLVKKATDKANADLNGPTKVPPKPKQMNVNTGVHMPKK